MLSQYCSHCPCLADSETQIVFPTPSLTNGLLVIGEAPGKEENLQGEGFVGMAGKTLDRLLAHHQIKRNEYGRANVCRCRPPDNRKPTQAEIAGCLPFLAQFIIATKPKVILTIGATPSAVFCGKGSLYSIISQGLFRNDWTAIRHNETTHPAMVSALQSVKYIVPSPHTSPLAFNRNCPSGVKWGQVAAEQVAIAIDLLHNR